MHPAVQDTTPPYYHYSTHGYTLLGAAIEYAMNTPIGKDDNYVELELVPNLKVENAARRIISALNYLTIQLRLQTILPEILEEDLKHRSKKWQFFVVNL